MKALTWCGKQDVRVENVPDPIILNPRDAIIKITSTCICGSDLHLYNGYIPAMKPGDILGHEFMGEIVELGSGINERRPDLKVGDRVVIPFMMACGDCWFCQQKLFSCCDNSNATRATAETLYGHAPAGLFGYSHILGGYAGGQAEYARVPFADMGCFKVPEGMSDEQVIFLTDIFPTGYQAIDNCDLKGGETVAIWGAGPVGQFAIKSAFLLGAERVIVIDDVPERLHMASLEGAETIDFSDKTVYDVLQHMTGGRGPDACIDCVGLEAHGMAIDAIYDRVKTATYMGTDRIHALRQAMFVCRKGGTLSIPGVYGGLLDKVPFGAAFAKGLTMKMGQTHVHKYIPELLDHIREGRLDPTFVITHRLKLSDAPAGYKMFLEKQDNCIKIVMTP